MKASSIILLLVVSVVSVSAQTYSIDWSKISAGGGRSEGGVYAVTGTLSQYDAGDAMFGGNFSLTGGFWHVFALPTPGAPVLSIRYTTTHTAVVSWPSPSTGFSLQSTSDLLLSNWVNAPDSPSDDGTQRFLIVTPSNGRRFFRLIK